MNQGSDKPKGRRGAMLALAAILLASLWLRYWGIAWPELHPDEPTIASWASWMNEHDYISRRFYANGFFQLVKPAVFLQCQWSKWHTAWEYFEGGGDVLPAPAPDMILFLRTVNVWLAVLTVAIFYLLARRVTGSRVAALAAAAFLAVSRQHVEHSHYAETDIAMLFTLSLALYLWVRVCDGARARWLLLAAFVSGWAIGTKFTLMVLVANVVVGAILAGRAGSVGARRAAAYGGLGLLLCLAGVVYTNRGMTNLDWFLPHVRGGLSSVYAERAGLLNHAAGDRFAAIRSNWNGATSGVAELGWGWIIFLTLGLGVSLTRAYRRFWPVTLLFPALYAVYFIFVAPWVRGQEFMGFLPGLALWAAMGAGVALAAARRATRPTALRALVAVALMAACVESGLHAWRLAGLFGWPEPRIQALLWLHMHGPLEAAVGVEDYTLPIGNLFANAREVQQVEWVTPRKLAALKLDYLARNVASQGRGTVDPRTGQLWPDYAENLRQFTEHAGLLAQWGPFDERRYTFAGHRIEWWEVAPPTPALALRLPYFRPAFLDDSFHVTVPGQGCDVGSAAALWVDRSLRRMIVNGPGSDHRTVYVVLQTVERPAEVNVRGLGCRRTATLGPCDAVAVPLKRPPYLPRIDDYDVIDVWATPVPHIGYIPCYGQLAYTPTEAALILYQKGFADRALALLKDEGVQPENDNWLPYVCAVSEGDWAMADRFEDAATNILARLEQARAVPLGNLSVNGHSGAASRDHQRIRLPPAHFDKSASRLVIPALRLNVARDEDRGPGYEAELRLPVRLAKGRYRARFTLEVRPQGTGDVAHWWVDVSDNLSAVRSTIDLGVSAPVPVSREVTLEAEQDYVLAFKSLTRGGWLEVDDLEIDWGEDDLLRPERLELYRAVIRHALHKGMRGAAAEGLARARAEFDGDLELDRLELEALAADGQPGPAALAVAERIVKTAPDYGPALAVLATRDEAVRARWNAVEKTMGATPVLYPWLRLVRLGTEAATGRRQCVFEVLRDGVPPLKVYAWSFKNRHARDYDVRLLSDRALHRGERLLVTLPPRPDTGAYAGAWLTVETSPLWVPTPLPLPADRTGRIPLE